MKVCPFIVRALLAAIAVCASFAATSGELTGFKQCQDLNKKLDTPDGNFRPPYEAVVTSEGRTYLHSAPSLKCKTTNTFVVKSNHLTAYKPHQDWLRVMYIKKDGETVEGWVQQRRVKLLKRYGQ